MIATEKHLFIWCESFRIAFQFHSEGELCLSFKGLLTHKRKGEPVPGTFILLILLTHTSLHRADILLKDIQDSFSYSSVYFYYTKSLPLVIRMFVSEKER